jgi:hypothetical protein
VNRSFTRDSAALEEQCAIADSGGEGHIVSDEHFGLGQLAQEAC